ncbi:protein-arginine kinase [Anaerocolumna cellulosilytica]|uniref:Protein-arginine kinase n=1 Tax=Anaerocolumna cellulosilytica TaxID=433286 RepID=A0A6S6R2B7_9FIRM|nr:protein arginine kinase [Anaerocolumna cellulosilytica]MBB5194515.1 protein arginine kinase [Anaerocolumna cellulosilytica]BCJ93460.1 protein-arginine kinase [Anaerocolumna cellulosilytica]
MLKWYKEAGNNSDVIISSRVRLARNLKAYPFSAKLSENQAKEMVTKVKDAGLHLQEKEEKKYYSCNVDMLSDTEKTAMMERHIISPLLIAKEQSTGLILSEDEKISIMINEEDHIRIQSIVGGMNMTEAFYLANTADDITSELFDYAFHEKYGYLTSCPTNLGTGLRASYMMFLPALTVAGKVIKLAEELGQYGIALRGTYGEASKSLGSLYQISNQKTLGSTEKEIMDSLNRIVEQVMKQERRQREYILTNGYDEFEDKVYRSYGVLKYAKQLSSGDAMTLLAQLKLGADLALLKFKDNYNIHELMMEIQPANLQCQLDKNIGSVQRDKYRADYIRKKLPDIQ